MLASVGAPGVLAATLVEPGRLELRRYPYPERLEPGAVLLRMLASGICGTDKHTFRGESEQYAGTDHARSTPFPIIQGHENVGIVAQVGPGGALAFDGTPLAAGDRVVPAPNRACGRCAFCSRGFPYYLCVRLDNYGNSLSCAIPPHLFGGWAEHLYLLPGTPMFRVPDELPTGVAVLTELFAVTHSLELAARHPPPGGFRAGDAVAVVGVGPLGLVHVVKAFLMGAGRIIAVDRVPARLELAGRLGASDSFVAGEDTPDEVRALTSGLGADVVVDATGSPDSFGTALALLRDGGTLVEVGAFVDLGERPFNPALLCGRNLTLVGVGGEDARAYEPSLRLLARNHDRLGLERSVTHVLPLERAAEAMATAMGAEDAMKVVLAPGGRID
jgi:threonine dehydrogenase-like Zn-dependent dehydrogenase